jgi:nucleoside-diphosphate-sugar epimerase
MSGHTRVLFTGASGFIGRSTVPLFLDASFEVGVITRQGAADLGDGVNRDSGTVISAQGADLVKGIREFDPDVIVHLATHFVAVHEVADINSLVRSNIEFGTYVLEGAFASGARFLNINSAWQHVDGADYAPVSLYAATKQAFSDIATYYRQVRALLVDEVTLFDTYGADDTRMKLVPLLLDAARSGESLDMSDGHQLIDLTYVDDVAAAILNAASNTGMPQSTVARSWQPVTVREVVSEVERVTGTSLAINWGARPARPLEMKQDWVFGVPLPGWEPTVTLSEGLSRCWEAALSGPSQTRGAW